MNFSILSQFFGLTSAPPSDQTGRAGAGLPLAAGQGAPGAAGYQTGEFATLLQALGLTAGAGVTGPGMAGSGNGAGVPGGDKAGNVTVSGFLQAATWGDGGAEHPAAGLALTGTIAPAEAAFENPGGAAALVIQMEDGTTLTLDAARLAEMVKGTASPEEMALFEQTPLGQLLQRTPELRNMLTGGAPDPAGDAPADLLATLDDDERAMILAAMGLIAPREGEQRAAPAAGQPAVTPAEKPAGASQPVDADRSAGNAAGHLPTAAAPDGAADDVAVAPQHEKTTGTMSMAAPEAAARKADTAATAEDGVGEATAAGRSGEARETATTTDPSRDKDIALADTLGDPAENDAELAQPPVAAARGRRSGTAKGNTGEAASANAGAASSAGTDKAAGQAAARESNAPAAELRRPAQQTATDMLALLRSDWGSGWSDGWADPRENPALSGSLSGLSALSPGGAGAARAAAQPLSYNFAGPVVANQVALQISRSIQSGADSFQIRLDPPELGRVDVKLDIAHDGRVTAVVAVDNDQTLQMLLRDQGVLERALQDAGLKTDSGSLNFSLNQGGGRDDALAQDHRRAPRSREQDTAAAAEAASPQPVYLSDRALDLRV